MGFDSRSFSKTYTFEHATLWSYSMFHWWMGGYFPDLWVHLGNGLYVLTSWTMDRILDFLIDTAKPFILNFRRYCPIVGLFSCSIDNFLCSFSFFRSNPGLLLNYKWIDLTEISALFVWCFICYIWHPHK